MKGQGGGGTARGGGKNRSGGGTVTVTKTKARQTKAIDAHIMTLRAALFDDKGKDKDVTASILKNFLAFTINDQTCSISFSPSLSNKETEWAFELAKRHMETVYDQSGYGWDDDDKFRELTEQGARFLLVRDAAHKLVGYVHFRFTVQGEVIDQMAGLPCLYVVDLVVEDHMQRHGLGKHLLVLLELIGRKEKVSRVSIPVYQGHSAAKIWLEKSGRGFTIDESYSLFGFDSAMEGFEMFSKVFPAPAAPKPAPVAAASVAASIPAPAPAPAAGSQATEDAAPPVPPTTQESADDWVVVDSETSLATDVNSLSLADK